VVVAVDQYFLVRYMVLAVAVLAARFQYRRIVSLQLRTIPSPLVRAVLARLLSVRVEPLDQLVLIPPLLDIPQMVVAVVVEVQQVQQRAVVLVDKAQVVPLFRQ
jgi:hypothetical protein